jgi:hypothetical protein
MSYTPDRKALHAFVDIEIHEAWHDFAGDNGFSVSALLAAIGSEIDEVLGPDSPMGPVLIARARRLDAASRRRAGRRRT